MAPGREGERESERESESKIGTEIVLSVASLTGCRRRGRWERFTVYVALRGGEIFALCPIVPFGWCVISLTVSISLHLTPSVSAH